MIKFIVSKSRNEVKIMKFFVSSFVFLCLFRVCNSIMISYTMFLIHFHM